MATQQARRHRAITKRLLDYHYYFHAVTAGAAPRRHYFHRYSRSGARRHSRRRGALSEVVAELAARQQRGARLLVELVNAEGALHLPREKSAGPT